MSGATYINAVDTALAVLNSSRPAVVETMLRAVTARNDCSAWPTLQEYTRELSSTSFQIVMSGDLDSYHYVVVYMMHHNNSNIIICA